MVLSSIGDVGVVAGVDGVVVVVEGGREVAAVSRVVVDVMYHVHSMALLVWHPWEW